MTNFVHLHVHSEYSLLDGACRIKDIPKAVKAAGQNAVAITDHGVMYGAVAFYKACKEEGIKPIIGCEVYLSEGDRKDHIRTSPYFNTHLVLLVKNEIGYRNLIALVSKSFLDGYYVKPRIDLGLLRQYSQGLICLSGCLSGRIAKSIILEDFTEAESFAEILHTIFGHENFYLELQDHKIANQQKVNLFLSDLSKRKGYQLVATNDVHYLKKEDAYTQSVLMCIQTGKQLEAGKPFGFETDEFYLKTGDEMDSLFSNYPQAVENTVKIADACQFDFSFGKTILPEYIPEDRSTPKSYLEKLAKLGLEQKIADGLIVLDDVHSYDEYKSRMIYELLIIEKMGYEQYYLIVWDFIQYAKKQGIPVGPGRGSGAGSLVAYLIGITEVDSIRYNLLFERFLNPERVSMPDFDTDFCYNRREEVIQYVSQRYGIDHVSQIVTFGTMAARAAVRDVGRVLGMSYAEIDDVARKIPREMGITITKALEDPDLKIQYRNNEKIKKLLDLAIAIEGMPRHASTHAAGVVITKDPISTYVPMSKNGDTIVTQFDMDTIASLGLLKFDFLGLRYLTILSDAEKEVQKIQPDFSLSKIDLNDQDTYCLIASGKTDGVFQLESAGMKRLLANMKPNKLEDIMISIALYRPGPMDSIPKFLENREKSKSEKLTYPITILADILDCTYGCIIYQEQVMQICRKVAGFSYGKADIIRKAMSKKKGALLENERSAFLTGAKKNLISEKDADALFEEMVGFAKYAFNKSHAAAYSIVTYRTAYLKTHYPAPFFAALLTSVIGDPNKTSAYADDCMHFGIQILPPDINTSESNFSVSGQNILYGLTGIRSIGDGFVKNILKERKKGKFVSFMNFCTRMIGTELTKQQLQALISVGAFDSLDQNRAVLLASYESVYAAVQSKQKIELDGQTNLFAQEESEREENYPYPKLPDLTSRQKLILEKANIGVYLTGNLLDDYQQHIQQIPYFNIASILHSFDENSEDFGTLKDSQCVTVVGILSKVIKKTTKNKEEMAFLTIEDRTGEIEAIAFSKIYSENSDFLNQDTAVAVYGEIASREEESPKLIIRKIIPLKSNHEYQDSAATSVSSPVSTPKNIRYGGDPVGNKLYIRLESFNSPLVKKVQTICEIFCDGNCKVFLFERASGKYLTWSGFITADEYVVTLLRKLVGNENVVVRN